MLCPAHMLGVKCAIGPAPTGRELVFRRGVALLRPLRRGVGLRIRRIRNFLFCAGLMFAFSAAFAWPAAAQNTFKKAVPTAADWAAVAKLPDFTGVWEIPLGGSTPRATTSGAALSPRRPVLSLTPEYEVKRKALMAN